MAVKFGLDQIGKPAPKWYSTTLKFLIVILVPATATLIVGLPDISANAKIITGLSVTWTLSVLEGLEILLGEVSGAAKR